MELTTVEKSAFEELVKQCTRSGSIDPSLYVDYDVKRGLRDSNGNGVLTGLTEISDVVGTRSDNGRKVPVDGELYFQGFNVAEIIAGFGDRKYGFEETTYLLLFGKLPTEEQRKNFIHILTDLEELSGAFLRDVIMKATSTNLMNSLMKSILSLYSYDENPDDVCVPNVLRQSLQLIAKMPLISVYAYQAYRHYKLDGTLMIKNPRKDYSIAENILYMLRDDGQFTELEAKVLDICLVLHAEHGGGNNSTFTTHVVTSSGTDTYSAIAASIASLKGPKHGGANLKVQRMFADIMEHCSDWENKDEICEYLLKILDKQAFDHAGLIYGMGHAVYTLSDPRAVILKKFAKSLSEEKGMQKEFALYELVEREAGNLIMQKRQMFKPVCANVDFYSGFVYSMLGIPEELFTPIFAISRVSGWCSHRLEELVNAGKQLTTASSQTDVDAKKDDITAKIADIQTQFTITATADNGGTIAPTGATKVYKGTSKAFTITPNAGYHVDSLTVDGTAVNVVTEYTFSDVTANHTIAVTFAKDAMTVAKENLLAAINTANEKLAQTDAYTPASLEALQNAVDEAQTVYNKADATQTEVDNAKANVEAKIAALKEKADKSALRLAVKAAEGEAALTDKYTEESIAALQTAIDAANRVLADDNATQAEVDAQVEAVNAAKAALEEKKAPVVKEELEKAVADATEVVGATDKYTAASLAALQSAIDAANAVLQDPDATQDEIDAAVQSIKEAKEALKAKDDNKKDDSNKGDDKKDDNNGSNNNGGNNNGNTNAGSKNNGSSNNGTANGGNGTSNAVKAAKTGDTANVAGMAMLCLAAGLVVVMAKRRRTN